MQEQNKVFLAANILPSRFELDSSASEADALAS
jgi:hypothetical protein